MTRQRSKRKTVNIEAELIVGGRIFPGVIGNVSEGGAYVEIESLSSDLDCVPESSIELEFKKSGTQTLNVSCSVARVQKEKNPVGSKICLGLIIHRTPSQYRDFVDSL